MGYTYQHLVNSNKESPYLYSTHVENCSEKAEC